MDWLNKNIESGYGMQVDTPTYPAWIWDHLGARQLQAKRAIKDTSCKLVIGRATGTFLSWGDYYAYEEGTKVVATVNDLSTHMLALGGTGSGKTRRLLLPFVVQWILNKAGGLVLLDGKGPFPAMFRGMKNYTLIEPMDYDYEARKVLREATPLALIEGIPAGYVTEILAEVSGSNKQNAGSGQYFKDAGMAHAKFAEHLVWWLAETERQSIDDGVMTRERRWHWTIADIVKMVDMLADTRTDASGKRNIWKWMEVLRDYCAYVSIDDNLMDAMHYAEVGVLAEAKAEQTLSNIVSTIKNTWYSPLMQSKEISAWCRTETADINILSPLRGGCLGIHIAPRYGLAGKFATALIRRRIWQELQKRDDDWQEKDPTATRVLFVMDEAQDLLNAGDLEILAKGRSLGAHILAATQMLEGLVESMGIDKSNVMLGNFLSKVVLPSTKRSFEIIQEHIGVTRGRCHAYGGVWGGVYQPIRAFTTDQKQNPDNPHQYTQPFKNPSLIDRFLKRRIDLRETESDKIAFGNINLPTGNGEEKPLVSLGDFQSMTKQDGMALVIINRAGVQRRDFVQLPYMASVPPELFD